MVKLSGHSSAELAAIRRVQANPFVLDLIKMNGGVILNHIQIQIGGGEAANRGHDSIRSDNSIALGADEINPVIQQ